MIYYILITTKIDFGSNFVYSIACAQTFAKCWIFSRVSPSAMNGPKNERLMFGCTSSYSNRRTVRT